MVSNGISQTLERSHQECLTLAELKFIQRIRQLTDGLHLLLMFKEGDEPATLTVVAEKCKVERLK